MTMPGEPRLDGNPNPPTLGDIIRIQAQLRPDAVAMTFEGRTTRYAELERASFRVANALHAAGLVKGDRIAILAKNSDSFFEIFLGAAIAGVVFVPVNWRLSAAEIRYILDDAKARILFTGEEFPALAEAVVSEVSQRPAIVHLGDGFQSWRDQAQSTDPAVPVTPGEAVIQLYTSGTTGRPKGVLLSHRAINSVRVSQPLEAGWSQWAADDVCLVAMPLFHIGGIGHALASIYHGAKIIIAREFVPQALFDFIEQDRVTKLFIVPSALRIVLDDARAATTDYSRLRYVFYGSSPIAANLLQEAMSVFGCAFVQVYGMTETSGTIVVLSPEDHHPGAAAHRLKSAGKPLAGVEVAILDNLGNRLGAEKIGEVAVRSSANMLGYWGLPKESAAAFTEDGFLRSGDSGYLDADGYLYIRDRIKDMIITGGENVYAAEVEAVLAEHPAIAEVAIIGIPDEKWGEAVKAVIVPRPGEQIEIESLRAWARSRLAAYKLPKSVDLTDALPKNAAGKILRRIIREPYWRDQERSI